MSGSKKEISLGYTNECFPESCHVCLIYDNEEQRKKIVSEYLAAGIRQGELVRYITDTTTPEEVYSWLLEIGIKLPENKQNSSFVTYDAGSFYCSGGRFDPQKLIDGMLPRFKMAKKAGYSGSRACGEMSWVLKGYPGSEHLLEYEALLGTVDSTFPHSGMCQYDARLFDGATLFKILQVHPYMIAQGQIVRNPYYIKPEEFRYEHNPEE